MTYSRYDKFCYDCKRRSPYKDCQMSRTYEVEIQVVKSEIYHINAKDDADLIEKNKGGLIEEEGKLVRTDEAENTMGGWKDISNAKK